MSVITPAPEGGIEIINYDEFPNNVLSKVGGKWEGFNMNLIDEDNDRKLYSGIAKGWFVWALVSETIEFKFTYKSTEIITKIFQWDRI